MNYTETTNSLNTAYSLGYYFGYAFVWLVFLGLIYLLFRWFSRPTTDLAKRVEKFKKELSKQKGEPALFNIWAFLFSSFFFWYIGMSWMFILFLILPWIVMLPFLCLADSGISFLIGFTISHIVAGFVANRLCKKYKENYILTYKDADLTKAVLYRPISIKKLVIMNILTAGLYSIYWSFKNWHAYQTETKDDVNPYIRSWFCTLTMYDLFTKMTKTMKSKTSYAKYGFLFFALSALEYMFNKFTDSTVFSEGAQGLFALLSLFMPLIIVLVCFVPVQKVINQYAQKNFKQSLDKKFYVGEIIWLILGLLLNFVILFGNPFLKDTQEVPTQKLIVAEKFTKAEQEKIYTSLGFIYRHVRGYAKVCLNENYELKKYPNNFIELVQDDIKKLEEKLAEKGISLEQAMSDMEADPQVSRILYKSIYTELDQLKKSIIIGEIAHEKNVPEESVEWNDNWDNLMTFRDACEVFDNIGIEIFKNGENRYFLKSIF